MPSLDIDIPLDSDPNPEALQETVTFAKRLIKDRTPIQTGNLKRRWRVEATGTGLRAVNSADYASYVEDGTSKMTPRNMVSGAVPEIEAYYRKQAALRQRVSERRQRRTEYRQNPGVSRGLAEAANLLARAIADGLTSQRNPSTGIALDLAIDVDAILNG